jgi:membrane-bound inhibitor of C-type lysozyme
VLEFFDDNNNVVDTHNEPTTFLPDPWAGFHGFESTVPIKTVRIAAGFGIFDNVHFGPLTTAPTLSIDSPAAVSEGSAGSTTTITFIVTLSATPTSAVTVSFASADGSATIADTDYASTAGSLTFAAATTTLTQNIVVTVNGDSKFETDETFTVSLSSASGATIATDTGTGTITNDDSQPTISINDVTLTEGNSGTTSFTFTVSLSSASSSTVTVGFSTQDGTALSSEDYATIAGTLTFAPDETTQTITVNVNGDTTFEDDETFFVNLNSASGATIVDGQGVGTISNDDTPTLSIDSPVAVSEGNAGTTTTITFTVTLSSVPTSTVTVTFASADGSATLADNDYISAGGSLTFAGATTTLAQNIVVTVNGDTKFETDETFAVSLSNAVGATIATGTGTGTISNDDSQPTIAINDVTLAEGNSGTSTFTFTVTLSSASSSTVTVGFSTQDGTALSSEDYATVSGTLTFAPDETTQTFTINVNGDTTFENDETFFVNLNSASGATIADGQGVGTISNDDFEQCDDIGIVSCPTPAFNFNFLTTDGITYCAQITNPSSSSPTIVEWRSSDGSIETALNIQFTGAFSKVVLGPTATLTRGALAITVTSDSTNGECTIDFDDGGARRKRQVPLQPQPGSSGSNSVSLLAVNGGARADPHFTGANGVKFDFYGTAGGIYQTFVAPQYQVNVHLAGDGPALRFMTRVGVVFRNVTMEFGIYRYTNAQMKHFNKLLAPHGASAVYHGSVLHLDLCPGHAIVVGQAHTSQPSLVHDGGSVFYYVNVEIRVPHCDDVYEGALGQTYKCKYVERREAFRFDNATEESFRVDSLAAHTSPFDANAACVAPRLGAKPMIGGRSH